MWGFLSFADTLKLDIHTHTDVFCGVTSGKSTDEGRIFSQTLISFSLVRPFRVSRECEVMRK